LGSSGEDGYKAQEIGKREVMGKSSRNWRRGGDGARFQATSRQHGEKGNQSEAIFDGMASHHL